MGHDDVDRTAATNSYNGQSFLTHRSVYTIPEDKEQDDGQVNTDSKFYGKLLCNFGKAKSARELVLIFRYSL